jgi:hypothetical protein
MVKKLFLICLFGLFVAGTANAAFITQNYADMYIYGNTTATTISASATWTTVEAFQAGTTNGVTYTSNTLEVNADGIYNLDWAMSATAGGTNKTYLFGFSVNGSVESCSVIERKFATQDVGAMAGTCILPLNDGDQIQFKTQNIADTTDITLKYGNVSIAKVKNNI